MKHILFLCIAVLIFSCQGEDGEPGAKGDAGEQGIPGSDGTNGQNGEGLEKVGFFEGTVAGVRKNGTAFNETFKYEYGADTEGFSFDEFLGKYIFRIQRQEIFNDNYLIMNLEVLNKGTSTEALAIYDTQNFDDEPLLFSLEKEIATNTLLRVGAGVTVTSTEFTHIVNPTVNASTYKFALGEYGGYDFESRYNQSLGQYEVIFKTTDGKLVYFEDDYENNGGSYYYGNLIKVLNADGTVAANAPYNQLRWSQNNGERIFRNTAGADLSSTETVPGDVVQITNYTKNATTGFVAFDFTVTIGTLARYNTSLHPLTISGKFNSGTKVYSDIVSRKRG